MESSLLEAANNLILAFILAYMLVLSISLLVVRFIYPIAWESYSEILKSQRISPDLVVCLRRATDSDPNASTNQLLQIALVFCEALVYPAGILFFAFTILSVIKQAGG